MERGADAAAPELEGAGAAEAPEPEEAVDEEADQVCLQQIAQVWSRRLLRLALGSGAMCMPM